MGIPRLIQRTLVRLLTAIISGLIAFVAGFSLSVRRSAAGDFGPLPAMGQGLLVAAVVTAISGVVAWSYFEA